MAEAHDAIWGFSYQQNGWQAACRTCGWIGQTHYESEQARLEMIDHLKETADGAEH